MHGRVGVIYISFPGGWVRIFTRKGAIQCDVIVGNALSNFVLKSFNLNNGTNLAQFMLFSRAKARLLPRKRRRMDTKQFYIDLLARVQNMWSNGLR